MENTRKNILKEEIRARQQELDRIIAQERKEFDENATREHNELLEQLRKVDNKYEALAEIERKKRKELCKRYGHYLRVVDRVFLQSTGLRTHKYGEILVTKETSYCVCCGKVNIRTVAISTIIAPEIDFDQPKKEALESLEKEIEEKQDKLSQREEAVIGRLTDLLEEYIKEVIKVKMPDITEDALEAFCKEWYNYD